jgi:hypothetical protein
VEIRLAEISAFQPFIAAYERTLAAKEIAKASTINKPLEAGKVITHLDFYAGWLKAFSALPVAKEVFEKRAK